MSRLPTTEAQDQAGDNSIFLSYHIHNSSGGQKVINLMDNRDYFFLGIKRSECEANRSSSIIVEVEKACGFTLRSLYAFIARFVRVGASHHRNLKLASCLWVTLRRCQ
jgi:hypothetical protein